jgi:hypothetical protein
MPALDKIASASDETSSSPKSFFRGTFDVESPDSVFKNFPPYRE